MKYFGGKYKERVYLASVEIEQLPSGLCRVAEVYKVYYKQSHAPSMLNGYIGPLTRDACIFDTFEAARQAAQNIFHQGLNDLSQAIEWTAHQVDTLGECEE